MSEITPQTALEALEDVRDRYYRMDMALVLLREIEERRIKEPNDGNGLYTYRSMALDFAWNALMGFGDATDSVQEYLGQQVERQP